MQIYYIPYSNELTVVMNFWCDPQGCSLKRFDCNLHEFHSVDH